MRKGRAFVIAVLFASLFASACSRNRMSGPSAGKIGSSTPRSGGSAGSGTAGAATGGIGGQDTLGVAGNTTTTFASTPAAGGQSGSSIGGSAAGGQTISPRGGAGNGPGQPAGGAAGQPTGGTSAGGQTSPGSGGVVTGGQGASSQGGNGEGGIVEFPSIEKTYSMDPGWLFIKQDVPGAEAMVFDERGWSTVSTPHTYNDVDSFGLYANHASGDTGSYQGPAWYRKHFKIPEMYSGNKAIIEFERIRTGAKFYLNGAPVGVFDDGISPCGIDVTSKVNFGTVENVLAVRVDNSTSYAESTTGVGFQWNNRATNPNYGGLIGHVWLHMPSKIYQTYPLYNNLQTSGIYVYGTNYTNINSLGTVGDLTVNVEAEVSNESGREESATLGAAVIDPATGATIGAFQGTATALPATATTVVKASGALTRINLWSDASSMLYNVVTTLAVGGETVNRRSTTTGFRKTEFKGGAGTGGGLRQRPLRPPSRLRPELQQRMGRTW